MAAYAQCFDSRKNLPRIEANKNSGIEVGIQQTPTLIIGGKMYPGGLPYDDIKKLVDSLRAAAPAPAPAAKTP
jgi:protein-disulfide isomerase